MLFIRSKTGHFTYHIVDKRLAKAQRYIYGEGRDSINQPIKFFPAGDGRKRGKSENSIWKGETSSCKAEGVYREFNFLSALPFDFLYSRGVTGKPLLSPHAMLDLFRIAIFEATKDTRLDTCKQSPEAL